MANNTSYLFNNYLYYTSLVTINIVDAGGDCVDANFPVANMQNRQVALTTRTDAKVAVKIQIDLGATIGTQYMKTWAILNHNFSGGTFDINSYTAADFTTGKVTEADDVSVRLLDVYKHIAAPSQRRYWEIDLTNVTTADTYFEIGYLMGYSSYITLTEPYNIRQNRGYGFRNITNETTHGIRWTHKIYEKRESFSLIWEMRNDTYMPSEIKTLYDTVYGDAYPFLFIPQNDETPCYYVYIANPELIWTTMDVFWTGNKYTEGLNLDLIEAVKGKS